MPQAEQNLDWASNEDVTLTVLMTTTGSIAGHTFAFTVRDAVTEDLVFQQTTGITITVVGTEVTPGEVEIVVPSASTGLTEKTGLYRWELWRTNTGNEGQVAHGPLEVRGQLYRPIGA